MTAPFFMALFFCCLTVSFAVLVALSKNLVYSAFSLLGVFGSVAVLYILLSADFVAIAQLVIYIGGILVLILFAIMLTAKKDGKRFLNPALAPWSAALLLIPLAGLLGRGLFKEYRTNLPEQFDVSTATIGQELLGPFLLPFEIVSLLLVLVLVGSIVLARRET